MAFIGTATVVQVSDSIVRITGLSLAAGASGIIGLADHTGAAVDVALPDSFNPRPYEYGGSVVGLSDIIHVTAEPAATGSSFQPASVAKSGSTTASWRATLSNGFGSGTPTLEIYVKIHT